MTEAEEQLCRRLGYQFNDIKLLRLALTHRSVSGENNERLEFLGDSLLNFFIAEALCNRYPAKAEGELSRMRSNLVKGETLGKLAKELNLGETMILGLGELKSGGFKNKSILADAFEAVIAAIYLDADMETCKERVLHWFEQRLNDPASFKQRKDPKTSLQEFLQANRLPLPTYTISYIEGEAHEQVFHVNCTVEGLDIVTTDSGKTRRKAEQRAAKAFLILIEQHLKEAKSS